MEKKYELSKVEIDRLSNLLNIARIQEELLNAVTLSYKSYILTQIFNRLGIDAKYFPNTVINIATGEMTIKTEDEKPAEKKEAVAKK